VDIRYNYTARREDFYRSLSTFDTFGRGWLRRNEKTQIDALAMTDVV
jgi:lysozyme family protein